MALTELDRSLLERCLKRDGSAWRDFVDRFAGLFVHVIQHTAQARSVKLTAADIDDLSAEIFLAILADQFAVLKHFRGECSLATYLTVIARRVVVREIIHRRLSEALGHVKSQNSNLPMTKGENQEIVRIENQELIQQMLAGLSEQDARIVRQFHLEGKTYREIGDELGVPENSIGPTLTRAREKLRQSLSASMG
ncbi:RNA polymerase sigma factor [Schlesneria paludicola]|uniref:RNA polymerase sigma factor n=1 Tax=Schlesneria paludicola TaxID=360056 RepID=UPI0004923E6B|nr:sigma-70 family RNA polymerase sigma factor [Schlesneria paludicola]